MVSVAISLILEIFQLVTEMVLVINSCNLCIKPMLPKVQQMENPTVISMYIRKTLEMQHLKFSKLILTFMVMLSKAKLMPSSLLSGNVLTSTKKDSSISTACQSSLDNFVE